ncbi:acyl-CoA thioesterase/bile acid-CoA:amino acid N-acyltransferase family protein [Halobacterium sp. R2-5]|uniref:acyl-CoA thioesterase/bile acid-CoA:amino acid N-acyltransferase family protein n=1 Tax=Halobacterium sp. R2-5 TaxID=2715751 RepID=UPI0014219D7D|nr:acyl-CoA thioesterase/bile acid-CoA:amino acid N-acyltransferase family protein [Halobacterium sp. R2-5]NIB99689.1 dienelactone hydrolase [Halobacterium sp. R2-5]
MTEDRQSATSASTTGQPLAIDAPDVSPNDEPVTVRITGAEAGEEVTLTAALEDADGVEFSSQATFTADENGVVDCTEHAPDAGSYHGVEPMGWLWSMTSDADAPFARFGDLRRVDIALRAATDDAEAARTITRVLHDDVEARPVECDGLVGTLYLPPGDGPYPGVIELHGSGGRRGDGTAKRLASEGYAALALTYFGEKYDGLPDELERIPLSYAGDAADWLRAQSEVEDGRVGLVGASRGAEFALLLAAHCDWVGAVVSYAGSVPWDTPSGEPAWTRDGDPVPHLTAEEAPRFEDLDEHPIADVVPPVENADGPVLLLSGGDDTVWNSRRLSEAVADRLRERGFSHDFEHRTYDDCGHLVGTPYAPLRGIDETDRAGGTARGTARAGENAWPAVLDTLETGLKNER